MQKVLLIDDRRIFHWFWKVMCERKFNCLHAYTIQQARELFDSHPDISAIVVDAHMDGPIRISLQLPIREWGFNTHDLIRELSQRFEGPIIASPSQWWQFEVMTQAGCTHHCWK